VTVRVNLERGLGNQLFTLHAALALAAQRKLTLHIDLTGTLSEKSLRNSSIENLKVHIEGAEFPIIWDKDIKTRYTIWLERAVHKLAKSSEIGRKNMRQYRSLTYGYDKKLFEISTPTQIWGNYQSFRYPLELEKLGIKVDISVNNPSDWYLSMSKEAKSKNPISIHLRRGDYAEYSDALGLLSETYFKNVISGYFQMHERKKRPIWIFSDSTDAANSLRTTLSEVGGGGVSVIYPPKESNSAESLLLMSLSSVLVTSNSSFSWWAGWLGRSSNQVIVPNPYFKNFNGEFTDHIPPNWQSFPSDFL
jgi:hypothetical protein